MSDPTARAQIVELTKRVLRLEAERDFVPILPSERGHGWPKVGGKKRAAR